MVLVLRGLLLHLVLGRQLLHRVLRRLLLVLLLGRLLLHWVLGGLLLVGHGLVLIREVNLAAPAAVVRVGEGHVRLRGWVGLLGVHHIIPSEHAVIAAIPRKVVAVGRLGGRLLIEVAGIALADGGRWVLIAPGASSIGVGDHLVAIIAVGLDEGVGVEGGLRWVHLGGSVELSGETRLAGSLLVGIEVIPVVIVAH